MAPYSFMVFPGNNSQLIAKHLLSRPYWNDMIPFDSVEAPKSNIDCGQSKRLQIEKFNELVTSEFFECKWNFIWRPTRLMRKGKGKSLFSVHKLKVPDGRGKTGDSASKMMINHFPTIDQLTTKDGLLNSLRVYYKKQKISVFSITPTTFVVKTKDLKDKSKESDWTRFIEHYRSLRRKNFEVESTPWKHCEHNLWIIKPTSLNQGRGITVCKEISKIQTHINESKSTDWLIQKYIERPLLIDGRKFDIRVWALVTEKKEVYLYRDGYLRTSSELFTLKTAGEEGTMVHLTNYCMQKHSSNLSKFEEGNTLTFPQFQEYLDTRFPEHEVNFREHIWPRMREIVVDTLAATEAKLDEGNCGVHTFELYGYDFLIDEDFRTWLIEVNTNPFIGVQNDKHGEILEGMAEDLIRRAIDPHFPPPAGQQSPGDKSGRENLFDLVYSKDANFASDGFAIDSSSGDISTNERNTEWLYPVPGKQPIDRPMKPPPTSPTRRKSPRKSRTKENSANNSNNNNNNNNKRSSSSGKASKSKSNQPDEEKESNSKAKRPPRCSMPMISNSNGDTSNTTKKSLRRPLRSLSTRRSIGSSAERKPLLSPPVSPSRGVHSQASHNSLRINATSFLRGCTCIDVFQLLKLLVETRKEQQKKGLIRGGSAGSKSKMMVGDKDKMSTTLPSIRPTTSLNNSPVIGPLTNSTNAERLKRSLIVLDSQDKFRQEKFDRIQTLLSEPTEDGTPQKFMGVLIDCLKEISEQARDLKSASVFCKIGCVPLLFQLVVESKTPLPSANLQHCTSLMNRIRAAYWANAHLRRCTALPPIMTLNIAAMGLNSPAFSRQPQSQSIDELYDGASIASKCIDSYRLFALRALTHLAHRTKFLPERVSVLQWGVPLVGSYVTHGGSFAVSVRKAGSDLLAFFSLKEIETLETALTSGHVGFTSAPNRPSSSLSSNAPSVQSGSDDQYPLMKVSFWENIEGLNGCISAEITKRKEIRQAKKEKHEKKLKEEELKRKETEERAAKAADLMKDWKKNATKMEREKALNEAKLRELKEKENQEMLQRKQQREEELERILAAKRKEYARQMTLEKTKLKEEAKRRLDEQAERKKQAKKVLEDWVKKKSRDERKQRHLAEKKAKEELREKQKAKDVRREKLVKAGILLPVIHTKDK